MESCPQNPEFRNNPENIHPCSKKIIRIYHECEGGIEKSVMRITVWHHQACQVMKTDPKGQVFSIPHSQNNVFFFLTHQRLIILK